MIVLSVFHYLLALAGAPLLLGIINRTKAVVAGRAGPPLLQLYYDLWKLLHKGVVYSRTTTWVFRAGPIVGLAAVGTALLLVPFGGVPAVLWFNGDLVLLAYLLGVARFFTVAAALDTGSSFEGMGASREVFFAALVEPALLVGLAAVLRETQVLSLSASHARFANAGIWYQATLTLSLVTAALMVILLVENCRIPFDDPTTHLELTMIHEVMVLDHSGPDFAYILYGAALKLWLVGALVVGLVIPPTGIIGVDSVLALMALGLLAVLIGLIESSMARLRLLRVPQLLVGATSLAVLAFVLETLR